MTLTMQPLALFIRQLSIAAALGLALLAPSVFAERGSHIVLETPLPQPPWELPLIANGTGTIGSSTHDGKVIYVDFWASWCGPCRLSLPALDQISKDFDETDFRVVAVSVDYVSEDALDFPIVIPSTTLSPSIRRGTWEGLSPSLACRLAI